MFSLHKHFVKPATFKILTQFNIEITFANNQLTMQKYTDYGDKNNVKSENQYSVK